MSGCAYPGCGKDEGASAHLVAIGAVSRDNHAYVAPAPQPCGTSRTIVNGVIRCDTCGEDVGAEPHPQPTPSPATPDAPANEPYCAECGVTTEEDGHLGYGLCRDCYLNAKDTAARELAAHCARPAAPKLGVGDALRVDDVTLEHRLLDLHQPAKLNFNHAREWAIEYAEEVKQLRAQLAALTTPTLHTGTSPAEVIDALTSEVAGLRERLGEARLEGELAGLSQAFAVVSAHGKQWLAERHKDVKARIAALSTTGAGAK